MNENLIAIRESLKKKHKFLVDDAAEIEPIPSGAFLLDMALGCGGFPSGRLVELFGRQSTGKSTLALASMREAQAKGLFALYLDYENSFIPEYAVKQGVEVSDDRFVMYQPATIEQGGDILEAYISNLGTPVFAVVDSVAAMLPSSFLEGSVVEERRIGERARLMSQLLMRILPQVSQTNSVILFINHTQDKIGGFGYGERTTTPGGNSLKFYASVRVQLSRAGSLTERHQSLETGKEIEEHVGLKVRADIVKNKVGVPHRAATFYLRPPNGISEADTLFEVGCARELINRRGSVYDFVDANGEVLVSVSGKANALAWLADVANAAYMKDLKARLWEQVG